MRLPIPCSTCSKLACSLEVPKLEGPAAIVFRPMLTAAAARMGIDLRSAGANGNPLEAIPPRALSEILAVKCVECVAAANEVTAVA